VLFWPDPVGGGSGLPGGDKVVHAALFALLAATTRLRFGGRPGHPGPGALLVALAGYAAVSELAQAALLPTRSGDVWDLFADLVGVAVGWRLAGRAVPDRPAGPGSPVQVRT
jgi:VanZ family protein